MANETWECYLSDMKELSPWMYGILRILKWLLTLAVIGGAIYWFRFSPVLVQEHTVGRGEIVEEALGTGTLEARVKVTVSPKISGRLQEMKVDQGDHVAAGDLLVRLDDADLRQQVEIAQASLAAAKAAVERLKTDLQRAKAVLVQARRQHQRVQQLMASNAQTEADMDKAVESLAIAEAGVAQSQAAIAEGKTGVTAAEKTLAYHDARLDDTQINAPFAGLIIRRMLDPGDVVVPGTPILTLVSLKELWISAWVDETVMGSLAVDQQARVVFRSEADHSYPGQVVRLGKEADRETREFIVDVRVLKLPPNWAIGQRAEVYIETARKTACPRVPVAFLQRRENALGVFLDQQGIARWRPVTLGLQNPQWFEVVSGVRPGDVVVLPQDGKHALAGGERIKVQ